MKYGNIRWFSSICLYTSSMGGKMPTFWVQCGPKYQKSLQCGPKASFVDLFGNNNLVWSLTTITMSTKQQICCSLVPVYQINLTHRKDTKQYKI